MIYVADANFVLRLVDKRHSHHAVAKAALGTLRGRGDEIVVVAQSLFEFYVVATRPSSARGGLNLSQADALRWMRVFQSLFRLLPEVPLFAEWERLVSTYGTKGLPAHDARYIAAVAGAGVDAILTFNGGDFHRYAPEGVTVVDPASI